MEQGAGSEEYGGSAAAQKSLEMPPLQGDNICGNTPCTASLYCVPLNGIEEGNRYGEQRLLIRQRCRRDGLPPSPSRDHVSRSGIEKSVMCPRTNHIRPREAQDG